VNFITDGVLHFAIFGISYLFSKQFIFKCIQCLFFPYSKKPFFIAGKLYALYKVTSPYLLTYLWLSSQKHPVSDFLWEVSCGSSLLSFSASNPCVLVTVQSASCCHTSNLLQSLVVSFLCVFLTLIPPKKNK